MISEKDFSQLKFSTLKHFWGYDEFRDAQEAIIDSVISGNDTLVLLPTGGGKSLCYQLPALILEGTCLVVSPLLALMKDQVSQLKKMGVEAEYLSSELDEFDTEAILNRCKYGITKLLYVSPERLVNRIFLQNIEEIQVSLIAVDEAHCISEWGQDFRPGYQNIRTFRENLGKIPCLALTATATPKVLSEIQHKLGLKHPAVFRKSFRRTNIHIITDEISDKFDRIYNLMKYNRSSGIIYTRTRKDAEDLTRFLHNNNIHHVDFFHAGLPTAEKHKRQRKWLQENDQVLISTNAFGMGIDKENVRFVVHFSPPQSIENYYQEIGRAGRDGADSYAFMYWNEQELKAFDDILKFQIPTRAEFMNIVTYLYSVFQIAENDWPENVFQLNLQRIANFTKAPPAKIKNVLNFLHNQELVFFNNSKTHSSVELKISADDLDLLSKKDSYFMELLLRNLAGFTTHKVTFSENALCQKLGSEPQVLKERLKEMQQKAYLDYIDGGLASIKFLKHRDDRAMGGKYWPLFEQIQKNKIRKWEEMKFFTSNNEFCKMKMVLSYFGEKNVKSCGKCSVCEKQKEHVFGRNITGEILEVLKKRPSNVEEIAVQLHYYRKENVLENLIYLLDAGRVKMMNFRTYMINE